MTDTKKGFLKLNRTEEAEQLLIHEPNCYLLLSVIAYRAKRTEVFSVHNLKIGEALIGDDGSCGLTTQQYRTTKKKLEDWNFATFTATPKGTIAKLLDKRVFDINEEQDNSLDNSQITVKQQSNNSQITPNKECKKKKNEKNEKETAFELFWNQYQKKVGIEKAKVAWNKIHPNEYDKILSAVKQYVLSTPDIKYRAHPSTWLNQKRWNDEINIAEPTDNEYKKELLDIGGSRFREKYRLLYGEKKPSEVEAKERNNLKHMQLYRHISSLLEE